jgi:uncharacterized protein (UPF0333 family)
MRKIVGTCAVIVTAIVAAATFALPASAQTQANSPVAVAAANPGAHAVIYRVTTPYGTLTYGWRPLGSKPQVTEVPLSASGCNQDVCIAITGSSNHVSDWNTTAYWGGGYICTQSHWDINNNNIRTGTGACGRAGVFFSDWQANRYFPSPSLACNWWKVIPGYPCETIRK